MLAIFALVWVLSAGVTAFIAKEKGRDIGTWALIGLVFGVFGIVAAACIPDEKAVSDPFRQRDWR